MILYYTLQFIPVHESYNMGSLNLELIAWISNYSNLKLCDVITHPYANCIIYMIEVQPRKSN